MKRVLLILAAALLVSSCILTDFGKYWEKGFIDPRLEGKWDITFTSSSERRSLSFVKSKDSYILKGDFDKEFNQKEKEIIEAKSIKNGSYEFLFIAARAPDGRSVGTLFRYITQNNTVWIYASVDAALTDYAYTYGIKNTELMHDISHHGEFTRVPSFNSNIAAMLASVPDTNKYWKLFAVLQKNES